MLPPFLFPSYKQYKTDSDAVATWLANAAQQCGFPKDVLRSQTTSQKNASKAKGRARKASREAAHNKLSNSQSDANDLKSSAQLEGPKYLIAVNDFISLAEWIVKSTNPYVEVPASFVSILDRAITVRKRHHSWWYGRSKEHDGNGAEEKQANKSHGYFIGILEKVREVLQPRMPTELLKDFLTQPVEQAPTSKESPDGHLVNLFENLDIEESSAPFLHSESAPRNQKAIDAPQAQYGVNKPRESDLEEVYFAVHCLFNDFDNIRRYLQQVWKGYKQGVFDLVAASITTNTAIDFARHLQEDFIETFPKHTNFEEHINILYVQLCLANRQDHDFKERPDDEMNFTVYEDAEPMLFPTYLLLSSFKDIIEPGILPVSKPGHSGVYDASSDRESRSSRDKFREDKVVLLEILPDFCVFALQPGSIPAEDEMMRGVREMVKQNVVPIWLVFAAQIFLDIHHILRKQVDNGFDDLARSAKYVENNIQQALRFHNDLYIDNWPKSNDQGLYRILNQIRDWVKTDAVQIARTSLMRGYETQLPPPESFLFLKHHPLYCGLLSYSIKALAQEASIIFVNAWGSILYSAQLYNALRQEKLISNAWQDMDLALLMHRTEDIFIGDFPKTVDDYFKRFSLAMGGSVTMFAKNRRRAGVKTSKAGPRVLNELSPVSRMFKPRYCDNEGRTNLSLDDVDIILKKDTDKDDGTDSKESSEWKTPKIKINILDENPPTSTGESSKHQDRQRKAQKPATAGVRPIQLLNALLNVLQSETVELSFDHFRLHIFSWRLLRDIKEALADDLRKIYGPGYLEKENQLPFIVGYLFMTAVQTSKLAGVLVPKQQDVVTSRLLVQAAKVTKEKLETGGGGIEVKMLRQWLRIEVETPDLLDLMR
ncbi:hypothetical protein MMC20_007850 [Loxospora ochrophaea]|nr:hypothetical protein [Loxospora ochrophaea]